MLRKTLCVITLAAASVSGLGLAADAAHADSSQPQPRNSRGLEDGWIHLKR